MEVETREVLKKIQDRNADLAIKPWCAYRTGTSSVEYILDMIRGKQDPNYQREFPPRAEFDTEQEAMEYAMINNIKDCRYPFAVAKQEVGKPRKI